MKNVVISKDIVAVEKRMNADGVDMMFLRMNAALLVADTVQKQASGARIAVFCGSGGNGCDGLLAAIRLKRIDNDVKVYLVSKNNSDEVNSAAVAAKSNGVEVDNADKFDGKADIIIDAIFGIGLNRNIEGDVAELIKKLNATDAYRVAVDIPSGLNADTGEVMGIAFHAHKTVSFSCYKYGMLFGEGKEYCGDIVVGDVGIATSSDVVVYENADFAVYKRRRDAHKGTVGRIFVIGGCGTMIGAPMLAGAAAHAANLNGAGTVTVCVPKAQRVAVAARSTLAMMKFLSDTPDGFIAFNKAELDEIIKKADAIDIGMGMGKCPQLKEIISYLCTNFDGRLIIDADGLNSIAGDTDVLIGSKAKVVLTPHVGEFKRLTDSEATIENAVELAKSTGAIVVLKSATTIVTDGKEVRLNISGTPALAKGGSGDVLGGCIAALSCSYEPMDAATIACYRNGMGAERAVSAYSEMMLTPRDILRLADYKELDD